MTALKGQFDRYVLTARVLPGLIALAPLLLIVGVLVPRELTNYLLGLAVATGLVFLMAQVVRTLGRRVESRLVEAWDGLPTTHLLRYRTTTDRARLERRRKTLAILIGRELPSTRAEAANPAKADRDYVDATRQFISLVHQHGASFPREHEENINYGFIRNMLGMKALGIGFAVFAGAFAGFGHSLFSAAAAIMIISLAFVLLVIWTFYVTPTRVREAGDLYAARLFECLDTPQAFAPTAPAR